jgi:hypothetical protein
VKALRFVALRDGATRQSLVPGRRIHLAYVTREPVSLLAVLAPAAFVRVLERCPDATLLSGGDGV